MLALIVSSLAPLAFQSDSPGAPKGEPVAPTAVAVEPVPTRPEGAAWDVDYFKLPEGCVLEVGGMDFLSDGRLVVATRRGQVWMVENPLAKDVAESKITLFHEGLWEGLGLSVVNDEIYVLQRGELSRLEDQDGDGRCDGVVTIADDWGVSGHYHEFAFGLPRDKQGDWYMGLNVSFGDPEWWHGRSSVPYRGWIMRVSPDGTVTPWAHGVRSPNGVALDSKDRLFVTDNQGDWVASSPIYHIQEGGFYGHPKPLNWTDEYRASGRLASDEIPPAEAATERQPVAIWIPYQWSRSTGNLLEDTTGKFGVPKGQFVVAELTNGMILRAGFEEVQGVTQGWILPLVQEIGSVNRVIQAPDGSVFCGFTNRGWGGREPADGLARVRFSGDDTMEIHSMKIIDAAGEKPYGFELKFTEPIAEGWKPTAETVSMIQYDYDYWWEYGSPERHTLKTEISHFAISPDRKKISVRSEDLLPAMCVRIKVDGMASEAGNALLHPEISYTINQLPSGPKTNAYVSKIVPPPPSKGDVDKGVLRLTWGDALGQFEAEGWELCDAKLSGEDASRFETSIGNGALVATGAAAGNFTSRAAFGDAYARLDFMLPKGGSAAVRLADVCTIQLADDSATCGTIGDAAPAAPAYGQPGAWYTLEAYYRLGTDTSPATVDRVVLNGMTIHENLEFQGTSGDRGPISISSPGQVALRDIRVKPLDRPADAGAWTFLDPSEDWDAWEAVGDAEFTLGAEGVTGTGALGYLWAPVEGLADFTLRAQVQVNANGAGALVVRAKEDGDNVDGYAVRVNTSFPDGALSGSIRRGTKSTNIKTELIASDTWMDLEVQVTTGDGGTTVVALLNGVEVNRVTDPDPIDGGGIALRCDHEGTVLKLQNLRILK